MLFIKKNNREKLLTKAEKCEPLEVTGAVLIPVKSRKSNLDKIGFYLILGVVVFLPLFFSTTDYFPTAATKTTVITLSVLVIFALWLVAGLKTGSIEYPKGWLYPVGALVLLTYLLAAFFSNDLSLSFFGQGSEISTFGFIFGLFLWLMLLPYFLKERKKFYYIYGAVIVTSVLIALYHLGRIILVPFLGSTFLSFGYFNELTTNTIGKWNDLAVYFGIISILSLTALENLSFQKPQLKYLFWLTFILSLSVVSVVNFALVWYLLGLFSIISLVYFVASGWSSSGRTGEEPQFRIPYASLLVLVLALIFLLGGLFGRQSLGSVLTEALGISQVEARPTWSVTWDLAKTTIKTDPFFGVGPNRFVTVWLANKPAVVNGTIFWNTDFNSGIGFIPTLFITTGLVGAGPWLLFIILFSLLGFRAVRSKSKDRLGRYFILSSFGVSLYLWLLMIFYNPSIVTIFFTFFFSGLFLASARSEGLLRTEKFIFINNQRKSFLTVLVILLLFIITVSGGYFYGQKFISQSLLERGRTLWRQGGDIMKAEALATQAINLGVGAPGYRLLTDVYLTNVNYFLDEVKAERITVEAVKADFIKVLGAAVKSANQAIALDRADYENYLSLGQVYETVIPLGLKGSYEGARKAYEQALFLNPLSPYLYLVLARVEVTNNDLKKAEVNALKALELKTDYTDAAFLLSQIQISEGKNKEALTSLETASLYSANQPVIFFQIGILKYSQKDYEGAGVAFEKAVKLNQNYSNALYFLGLSYEKLGKIDWALSVFNRVSLLNPDNQEVKLIIKNLQAGREPFANAVAPIDSKPERRATLPIKEKITKTSSQR